MALYFYFNETTGDLVYSDQATYDVGGYTSLGQQKNLDPTESSEWVFDSKRASIKTVTKDPNLSGRIDVLKTMNYMFTNCAVLTSLDFSGFDTSNVTDMTVAFAGCYVLTSLDLDGLDTSSTTNMYGMFSSSTSLTSLDLGGFDTSNVTDMSSMFYGCMALTSLDLGGFDTSNVTDMSQMFYSCYALASLDLGGFNTSNVTTMSGMFDSCDALTSLDLSGFDTSNVTTMSGMFSECSSLRIIDISLNMSNVLPQLPADTYYDAATRQSYAKADIPGGSTYVRDLADLDLMSTMVQTRMGIGKVKDKLSAQAREIQSLRDLVSRRDTLDASSDWDDISIENGAWSVAGLGSGAPSGAFAWGVLMHFATAGGAAVQIYFPAKVDRLYFRTRYSQAWSEWYER